MTATPETATTRVAVLGAGAIGVGLAKLLGRCGIRTVAWARSEPGLAALREVAGPMTDVAPTLGAIGGCDIVLEAIAEDPQAKTGLYRELARHLRRDAIVATTTSSISVEALAAKAPRRERFAAFHVFHPVSRMPLVEICTPAQCDPDVGPRLARLAGALGKSCVAVPDEPGFLVNQLLFPLLFAAVEFQERSGLAAQEIDQAMRAGAGHPMGPLELLDFIGLDVALAIAGNLRLDPPAALTALAAQGRLGRKSGAGFYEYVKSDGGAS